MPDRLLELADTVAERLSRRRFLGWAGGLTSAAATAYVGLRHADQVFADEKATCCIYECFTRSHQSFLITDCLKDKKNKDNEVEVQACPRAKDFKIEGRDYNCSLWAADMRCDNCGKCKLENMKRCCRYTGDRCGTKDICIGFNDHCRDDIEGCLTGGYVVVCGCGHCPPD